MVDLIMLKPQGPLSGDYRFNTADPKSTRFHKQIQEGRGGGAPATAAKC